MKEVKNLEKVYDPKKVEDTLYEKWTLKGYFHAKIDPNKKPFTIVIPPPNITGQLHMGHALNNTLQDILIRFKRMQGFCALWVPGTDHASIATEARIVESMAKEGISKEDIGREKFLERAWEWKKHYGGRITQQLKKLGSSCDWERERFTMDEGLSEAVKEVFIRLYNKGLIYKGERIINWCPKCDTSISDAEVEHEEKSGNLWHIKYPIKDSNDCLIVATTRPETMLGDTALAVHPDDERYKDLIGKIAILPILNREIPIIADSYVEKDFGTGVVKITPAHDPNDFEVGQRHDLQQINILNDDATLNSNAFKYKGLDRYEARKKIVEELENLKLLYKIEERNHNVGTCYRCNTVIEPMIKKQWFVKMKELADPAIDVVRTGKIKFVPERFSKIYFNWMENIQDWCISRQLWWGHRIPAYYCLDCGHIMVERDVKNHCDVCSSSKIQQDPDTLDTWFSSALWPFSTLGWPKETEELKYFYPTDVLVTAADIIFFWVARMIFSGLFQMKEIPFKYVFINGIVRDKQGRKMSKSLDNGIDPLEVIDEFGTDALRFSLILGSSPGNDMRFSSEKAESSRNFANKIWNAARFVLMNFDEEFNIDNVEPSRFTVSDKWILSRVNSLIKEVTDNIDKFEFGVALQKIYGFLWEEYCDWYIELVKPRLYNRENSTRIEALYILNHVLCIALKLLHPFMPFITEEIYTHLINKDESIMTSKWPEYNDSYNFPIEEKNMSIVMSAIRSIRNIRAEMNVPVSKKASIIFVSEDSAIRTLLESEKTLFERLVSSNEVTILKNKEQVNKDFVTAIVEGIEILLPLEELVDINKEIERLTKEKENLEEELLRVNSKLSNNGFISKAPQNVIDEEIQKKNKYQEMYQKVIERLDSISK